MPSAPALLQTAARGMTGSQAGLLDGRTDRVADVADSDEAEIRRPQPDAAGEYELIPAQFRRPQQYGDAGNLILFALEHAENMTFNISPHALAQIDSFRSDGNPHSFSSFLQNPICLF